MAGQCARRARRHHRRLSERGGGGPGDSRRAARMNRRRRSSYGSVFILALIVVVLATGYTFWLMRPATAAVEDGSHMPPPEVGAGFAVTNVASIRPRPERY